MSQSTSTIFKAPLLLRNPHLQTCLEILGKSRLNVATVWEEVSLPDGDFVDLVWLGNQAEGPIAILVPGLEGGLHARYVVSLAEPLLKEGWRVVVVHFRCCSGRLNMLPRVYSANDSDDLQLIVASLRMQNPGVNIVSVGFSLGGSILLKMLEDLADSEFPSNYITAAVGISVPYDLNLTIDHIPKFYQWWMLRSMKEKVKLKIEAGFDLPVSLKRLAAIQSLREFDTLVTAPSHSFPDVESYYAASNCGHDLAKIKLNTLLIHSLDDPLIPSSCIPSQESLGENMHLELSEQGGHLGFLSSPLPWRWRNWLTQRVLTFLRPYLD